MPCREMITGEEEAVLELVMRGFDEFVCPDFSDAGVVEFCRAAQSFVLDRPTDHVAYIAEDDGKLLGMIDVRDSTHICLFFVDAAHQRQVIGRALLDHAIGQCPAQLPELDAFTVNSSPWAVSVYEKLGFKRTGSEQEQNGVRFVSMIRQL